MNNIIHFIHQPPLDSYPEHINTSSFHTKSHVQLGHTKQIPTHESTMKTSYHPLSTGTVEHVRASLKDNIPFDYSSNQSCPFSFDNYYFYYR